MFVKSLNSTSNLPKSLKMYLCKYWRLVYWDSRDLLLIFAKSYTGICEIIYWYWRNHLPILAKSYTGIGEILVLAKSCKGCWWNHISILANRILVYLGRNNYFCPWNFFEIDLQNKMKYLLQIDYWKWNFPMTQSIWCLVCRSIGQSIGRSVHPFLRVH